MIHDDQQQKIDRWNFARGLGDLTLDDLLSDSANGTAEVSSQTSDLRPPTSDLSPSARPEGPT